MKLRIADCGLRNGTGRVRLLALLLLASSSLRAQPSDVHATSAVEPKRTTLSGSVRVTVSIEGPAPLLVEPPKPLLSADANAAWRIRPDKDSPAAVAPAGNGRERWQQVYRLDPYHFGESLVITFAPFTVNGRVVRVPAVEVAVSKTVAGADAAARPVTPPEDVPVPPPPAGGVPALVWVAGAVAMGAAVLLAARAQRLKPKPVPPRTWALAELAKVEASGAAGEEVARRVSEVLRRFLELRFAIPATKLTTAELLAAAAQQGWAVEEADALRVVLDECDRAKFAGDAPDDDGRRRLARLAVDWLNHVGRPAGPG
jgi:hypothetical protein